MPALGRDPSFEFPDEESLNSSSDSEEDGSGDHEEKEDDNIDKYGSLGLTAMLLTAGVWRAPKQPKLKMPSLIANSITSVLFAGYLISFHAREDILVYLSEQGLARKAFTAYMQCAWQMARVNQESHAQPCQEYGVLLPDEVMVSPDGRRMLTNIGRNDWHEPPFWHPCKKTPGSDWNKFFKNVGRPLFVPASFTSTHVSHRLPNTALKLVEPVEEYYESVEDRMDDSGRDRRVLTLVQSMRQYEKLAAASGCEYPDEELEEHVSIRTEANLRGSKHTYNDKLANSVFDAQQDYKDSVPLVCRISTFQYTDWTDQTIDEETYHRPQRPPHDAVHHECSQGYEARGGTNRHAFRAVHGSFW